MALRNEEILRLKFELGYNITGVGAEPYISYAAVFDRAVQPYLVDSGTTSTTTVAASAAGAAVAVTLAANPASITATQALSFVPGSNVVVDVGPLQETSVILSMSGLVVTLTLTLTHGPASYPVLLNGGEQTIRDIFTRLDNIKSIMTSLAPLTAGVRKVDEAELFSSSKRKSMSRFDELVYQRTVARRDLAGALGVAYIPDVRTRGGASFEVY